MGTYQGNNRQLQPQQPGAIAQVKPQDQAALDMVRQADPELHKRVIEIMLSQPANKPLSAPRALAAAMYERENPGRKLGRDFYADEKMGIVPSYRGEQKDAQDNSDFYTQFRSLTVIESEEHEVQIGDVAIVCEGYQFALMRHLRQAGIRYQPTVGVGIVRKHERYSETTAWDDSRKKYVKVPEERWGPAIDPPVGKSWRWKAEQRAYKDCLRHMPGVKLPAEVLEDLDADGYEMPPETAHLSHDQAQAWAETRRDDAAAQTERDTMTPEERHSQAQANIERMRGPADFKGFGDDDVPPEIMRVFQAPEPDADTDFDSLPGAIAERDRMTVELADIITKRITDSQADGWNQAASDRQVGALQGLLHAVAPDAGDRQLLVTYLSYGNLRSAAEASAGFAGALIGAWTTTVENGEGKRKRTVTDLAKTEAAQIIAAANIVHGQAPLFAESPGE